MMGTEKTSDGDPAYNALQHEICVELGWCGSLIDGKPSHVDDLIPEKGKVTSSQFARWVLIADGCDPEGEEASWLEYGARIEAAFVRHMGADVVEAQRLKWYLPADPDLPKP